MKFDYDATYFNPKDVLDCGQIFRFHPFKDGYFVISADKACYVSSDGKKTTVESDDCEYFYNFFDLDRDYSKIIARAKTHNIPLLTRACRVYGGIRLLNQNKEEMLYSFIISQNNNIPRIKGIISRICAGLGEKREFAGEEYFAFPSTAALAAAGAGFFRSAGCGYRDLFLEETSRRVLNEGLSSLDGLETKELKKALLTYKGVGAKVADCVALFGFGKRDSFPVDVWVEKVYREDFRGELTDRNRITEYFTQMFGEDSGYIQQYLFHGKRQNL